MYIMLVHIIFRLLILNSTRAPIMSNNARKGVTVAEKIAYDNFLRAANDTSFDLTYVLSLTLFKYSVGLMRLFSGHGII